MRQKVLKIRPLREIVVDGKMQKEKDEFRVFFTLGEFVPLLKNMVSSEKMFYNHKVISLPIAKEKLEQTIK